MSYLVRFLVPGLLLLGSGFFVSDANAAVVSYYIGVDGLATIATGTYAGLPNPNYNNLTLLYAHPNEFSPASSHYHSKGILAYTGPNLGASTATARSASNFLPEGSLPPINLSAGTGLFTGKLVSNPYADPLDPAYDFSFLAHTDTKTLDGFAPGTVENALFNSSGGRWTPSSRPAHLHVEIVSLTPGLNVGDASTLSLGGVGTELHLSDPGDSFMFTPVLWTEASALPGTYEAVFRFFDEDGAFGNSGDIRYRVSVPAAAPVPEPGMLAFAGVSVGAVLFFGLRRRTTKLT